MKRITAIKFTHSWSGFVVRYDDGTTETLSPAELYQLVGEREYWRLVWYACRLLGHFNKVPAGDR
jgi:hypothetical protein